MEAVTAPVAPSLRAPLLAKDQAVVTEAVVFPDELSASGAKRYALGEAVLLWA